VFGRSALAGRRSQAASARARAQVLRPEAVLPLLRDPDALPRLAPHLVRPRRVPPRGARGLVPSRAVGRRARRPAAAWTRSHSSARLQRPSGACLATPPRLHACHGQPCAFFVSAA